MAEFSKKLCGARIEAVEQIAVRPFEIEGEVERLAHARVLQRLAPRIEEEALRAGGVSSGSISFFTLPSRIAGKLYSVAHTFEVNSSRKS